MGGQLRVSLPDPVNLVGGGTLPLSDVQAILNLHHEGYLYNSDESISIDGQISGFLESHGEVYINFSAATETGTPTDGLSMTLRLQSNLVKRGEFGDIAFDKRMPVAPTAESTTKFYRLEVPSTSLGTDPIYSEDSNPEYYTFFADDADVGGSANAITITATPTATGYRSGMQVVFEPTADNTASATINVDSLGAKTIVREDGSTLQAGDIVNDRFAHLVYDGVFFVLLNRPTSREAPMLTKPNITGTETGNTWTVIAQNMTGKSFEFSMIYDQNGSGNWGFATSGEIDFDDMANNNTRKHWIPRPADSGTRIQLNRNGTNLRAQLAGTIANVSAKLKVWG